MCQMCGNGGPAQLKRTAIVANRDPIHVDPEDCTQGRFDVLTVTYRPMRRRRVSKPIVRSSAIAQGKVQESVRAEGDFTGVVIELGLVDSEEDHLRSGIGDIGIGDGDGILGEDLLVATTRGTKARLSRIAGPRRAIANKEAPVSFVIRVKGQPEQSALIKEWVQRWEVSRDVLGRAWARELHLARSESGPSAP